MARAKDASLCTLVHAWQACLGIEAMCLLEHEGCVAMVQVRLDEVGRAISQLGQLKPLPERKQLDCVRRVEREPAGVAVVQQRLECRRRPTVLDRDLL